MVQSATGHESAGGPAPGMSESGGRLELTSRRPPWEYHETPSKNNMLAVYVLQLVAATSLESK